MCLADCTESAWCVVFDAAPSVLNKSADQINTMREQDEAAFQVFIDFAVIFYQYHTVNLIG